MHGSIPGTTSAPCARYTLGGTPTSSEKRVLKVPSEPQPTVKHTSVTLMSVVRSSVIARSVRLVMRYWYGVSR